MDRFDNLIKESYTELMNQIEIDDGVKDNMLKILLEKMEQRFPAPSLLAKLKAAFEKLGIFEIIRLPISCDLQGMMDLASDLKQEIVLQKEVDDFNVKVTERKTSKSGKFLVRLDLGEKELRGLEVQLIEQESSKTVSQAKFDENGIATFSSVEPGEYRIEASSL